MQLTKLNADSSWMFSFDGLHILVAVVEDDSGNSGNASADIEGIFEGGIPVFALVDAVVVSLGELAGRLASEDTG
jgi:hypothetical protein